MKKFEKKDGRVVEVLANGQFLVEFEPGTIIRCYLKGTMRLNKISVILGDRVSVELTPGLPAQNNIGRITFRNKN